tara:strand:+ start:961 stop:1317 length:357 start_codon:yes stop_codon:yes gene_type:complete
MQQQLRQRLAQKLAAIAEGNRAEEIGNACLAAGLTIRCVQRKSDGTYRVTCSEGEQEQANRIMAEVLSGPLPGQTPVETFEEAVTVIQFEPRNRQARAILRKRYEALRQRHRKTLRKD